HRKRAHAAVAHDELTNTGVGATEIPLITARPALDISRRFGEAKTVAGHAADLAWRIGAAVVDRAVYRRPAGFLLDDVLTAGQERVTGAVGNVHEADLGAPGESAAGDRPFRHDDGTVGGDVIQVAGRVVHSVAAAHRVVGQRAELVAVPLDAQLR